MLIFLSTFSKNPKNTITLFIDHILNCINTSAYILLQLSLLTHLDKVDFDDVLDLADVVEDFQVLLVFQRRVQKGVR
jgi:hypothetical protein